MIAPAFGAESSVSPLAANPRHTGSPFVRTWSADDYGAHPENHYVLQHPETGIIYVGNGDSVLEFDGVRWRRIPSPGNTVVTALTVDARGRVWGSGNGTIFRLEPDAHGEWQARSMVAALPSQLRTLLLASKAVATTAGVYFLEQKHLIFFPHDDGPARAWRVAEGNVVAIRIWALGDEPYVMIGGNLVFRLRAGKLERVPSLGTNTWAARAEPDGSWHLLSPTSVERWTGERRTTLHQPLAGDGAQHATFLADGRMVFATLRSGLVVCDREGRRLQKIDRTMGLPANHVVAVCEDREGGVWAAFRNGIARVQLDSPYARHGPAQGLEGTVHAMARVNGALFAGGTEGVARRLAEGRFLPVQNIPGPEREIVAHDGWLYSLSFRLRGVQPALGNAARELENRNYFGLVPLAGLPGWYAHGSNEGLRWAHFVGNRWVSEGPLNAVRGRTVALVEAPAGVVWATRGNATWRVDFRAGLSRETPAKAFRAAEGLPAPPSAMWSLGGRVVALAASRLFTHDEEHHRFAPETRIAGLEGFTIDLAHLGADGTFWLQGAGPARELRRVTPATGGTFQAEPLPGEPLRHLSPTTLFHDAAAQTLWIAGHGALVSRDLAWAPGRPPSPPAVAIRRVETAAGGLLRASAAVGPSQPLATLAPEQDALRISFAAPRFAPDHTGAAHVMYRTRLDGLDREWSAWSRQTERDFTNLPARAFRFRVQARDEAGRAGAEATLSFAIHPHWWATRWAWAGYGAAGLLAMAGVVRLRTRALQRRAERLEAVVHERTRELARSNEQLAMTNAELARLHQLELDEKIAAQLSEEKARLELLRYQLNPHFLYNSLNSIYGLLFENVRDAGEMVLRLSDFCRATLTGAKDELPTLAAEIDALRHYLDVEKVRWNEKLQIEFDVSPAVASTRMPPFLLLPLVENAIKYGSRTSPEILRLTIRARAAVVPLAPASGGTVLIEIANTGDWVQPSAARRDSTGIGLENLRQRLKRYYPESHEFTTEARDGWVIVRLQISNAGLRLRGNAAPYSSN